MRKRILLLLLVVVVTRSLVAQPYVYQFKSNLNENGAGPALDEVLSCAATAGAFGDQAIITPCGAPVQTTFNFTAGGGLSFPNSNQIAGSYTIHLLFKFDDYSSPATSGYERLIDFQNSTTDNGVYALFNCATVQDATQVGTCPTFADGEFSLATFVRDAGTDEFDFYVNGVLFATLADVSQVYVPPTTTTPIIFFRDNDGGGACESGSGSVRYLSISPTVATSTDVANEYANLCLRVLPVSLVNFTATKQSNSVLLKWATDLENNTNHFELERSSDGRTFTKLTNVTAANNSNVRINYSYVDAQPLQGTSLYRLKMVDNDGRYKYSSVLKITFGGVAKFEVFPNPAKESVTISGIQGNQSIKLINAHGVQMAQLRSTGESMMLDMRKYPAGIYILVYSDGQTIQRQKIVKE